MALVSGANGQGKSNLLESVYLLAIAKSPRAASDRELVRRQHPDVATHTRVAARLVRGAESLRVQIDLARLPPPAAADAGASLVVIDTAPREAGGAAEAARLADLVMIPCRPSAIDLAAIPATLAAIGMADALAVLNARPPRGPWTAQAADAVRAFGIGLAPVTLGARVAHAKAFTLGRTAQETEPASPAAREIADLYRWAMEAV